MQKRWTIKQQVNQATIDQIVHELKVSPLMAKILALRNLTTKETISSYFSPNLSQLHDPFLMKDLPEAVKRLKKAIENQEKIMIYGDYDVDGTTSVALFLSVLEPLTSVSFHIPDRHNEGYGISFVGIDKALEEECTLMIALDCGIKEIEKVNYAKSKGLDVIVCDHHTPGEEVPSCLVLNPKQSDCNYPYKELCGCGVGFKLLQGLFSDMNFEQEDLFDYLDYVAVAIGADMVPVTGENRVLAHFGLQKLNENQRTCFAAIAEKSGRALPYNLSNVCFVIAPRINAAGRLEHGSKAVDLLISPSLSEALKIAEEIEAVNAQRKNLDSSITDKALEIIENDTLFENRKSTVVFHESWHKGVVGIVASRLIEKHYRPTVVLTENNGKATGSARSVPGINLYDALSSCAHLLDQYGGHAAAAGLTLDIKNIAEFSEAFDKYVQANIKELEEVEEIEIDVELKLEELFLLGESMVKVPRILSMQEKMEPFGNENQKPYFLARNVYASSYRLLKNEHLKLDVMDVDSGITLPAIGFFMRDYEDLVASGCAFDLVFSLEVNEWNHQKTLQLQIRDIRESEN